MAGNIRLHVIVVCFAGGHMIRFKSRVVTRSGPGEVSTHFMSSD